MPNKSDKRGQKSVQYGIDSFANGTTKCWETKGWEHNGDGKHKRDIQTLESLEWKKKRNLRRKSLISKKKKEKNEYELSNFFFVD